MRDLAEIAWAWGVVAHSYLGLLRRALAQAAPAAEGEGEAPLPAGVARGGARPHDERPAA